MKPGNKSRGRGIKIYSDFDKIKRYFLNFSSLIIMKYIENPLIILQRKVNNILFFIFYLV